jgi:hypothetical protein
MTQNTLPQRIKVASTLGPTGSNPPACVPRLLDLLAAKVIRAAGGQTCSIVSPPFGFPTEPTSETEKAGGLFTGSGFFHEIADAALVHGFVGSRGIDAGPPSRQFRSAIMWAAQRCEDAYRFGSGMAVSGCVVNCCFSFGCDQPFQAGIGRGG